MKGQVVTLSIYLGESQTTGTKQTGDALIDCFAQHGVAVAVLYRGIEGFGIGRRIHTLRFPDISTDLPLLVDVIDTRERIESLLDDVDRIANRGLVTLEPALLVSGDDLLRAEFPPGPGRGAKLTVYCGRADQVDGKPAYRVVVDLLRRQGAAGATVLLGVDGVYRGRRERAGLFTRNANVPMAVASLGEAAVLQGIVPLLCEVLERPLVNLERVVLLKHDGQPLEPLPSPRGSGGRTGEIWQAVRIYTRQTAQFEGRTLYTELTRRLREAGAAGVTTIRGEWGFSGDEAPYGDRFGTLASHVPTYTVYIDRPQKVVEVWPLIDEVTAEHGIVTATLIPGYRERAGETVHGHLELSESELLLKPEELGILMEDARPSAAHEVGSPDLASEEVQWLRALAGEAANFARERGRGEPLVRVTLIDGEHFFLASAEPRPGKGFVTLYPHPARYAELVQGSQGELVAPRALLVPLSAIAKIEFLTKPPRGTRSLLGFRLPQP